MPANMMYAIGNGNKSSVPMMLDHFPVTISTHNTNEIFTMDIETKPRANRRIIYGIKAFTNPIAVPE